MKKILSKSMSWILSMVMLLGGVFGILPQITDSLIASAASVSEKESNDTMATAQTIVIGDTVNAKLSESDKKDFFKVVLPESGGLYVDLDANMVSMNAYIEDMEGNVFDGGKLSWNEFSQTINYTLAVDLNAGSYYIFFEAIDYGSYTFKTRFESADETVKETEWGSNNTEETAIPVTSTKTFKGQIAANDDCDIYKFEMKKGQRVEVLYRLYHAREYIAFYTGDGRVIHSTSLAANMVDGSYILDVGFVYIEEAGTYYFKISRDRGSTGLHEITFNIESSKENFPSEYGQGDNTPPTANLIDVDKTYYALLGNTDSIDYYKFTLTEDTTVNLYYYLYRHCYSDPSEIVLLTYYVYDNYGNIVYSRSGSNRVPWNSEISGVIMDETIDLPKGTYYISFSTGGRTFFYKFSVNTPGADSIKLSSNSITMNKGETKTLTATLQPNTVYNKTVTWTSSNKNVATVSNGKVKAVAAGTATITAKTVNGKTAKCKITVTDPAKELKLNDNLLSSSSVKLGESVTVSASASGGTAPYLFAVYYKKSADTKWTTEQNYSKNTTIQIKPAEVSDYDVCVKVKDSTGKIVKNNFTFKVFEELKNTTEISSLDIGYGDKITVKAKATGGVGNYTYAVYYKKTSETKWTTVQNYSSKTSITIKPKYAGEYDISVKAKDGSGTIVKKSFKVKVTKPTNTSKVSSTTINLGDTIKIKCSATGSSGFYKYAVYYKKASDTSWKTKQDYAPNYDVTFKPASKTKYNLCVKIIDNFGNVAKKNFTITVK